MASSIILTAPLFKEFIFPFFLVFFILFAILEKSNIFGDDKKSLNAWTSFVLALIFVGAAYPTNILNNMVLFLVVAMVILFVGLLLWGFAIGGEAKIENKNIKWVAGIVIVVAMIIVVIWATGFNLEFFSSLFQGDWSQAFWINLLIIALLVGALALVISKGGGSDGGSSKSGDKG